MSDSSITPSRDELFALYERVLLIRRTEERLRDENRAGNLPGAVHLYIGEEAVATGVCANLRESDMITSTHRGHGHYLAKGGDLEALMAEIYAKKTGICQRDPDGVTLELIEEPPGISLEALYFRTDPL